MVESLRNKIELSTGEVKGFGYLKSLNSHKDYSLDNPEVKPILKKINLKQAMEAKKLPLKKDLRPEMTPVRDQQSLGSCTAFAASALVEYFQKKTNKRYTPVSTMFTYKTTRNLLKLTGDTGAYLRSVMGSIALFGCPPEEYWSYDGRTEASNKNFDKEPPAFCYALGSSFQSLKYVRFDQPTTTPIQLVALLKKSLSQNLPIIFGFTCFSSLYQYELSGDIPFPSTNEQVIGGHAVCLAGYDDNKEIVNADDPNIKTKGAFLFKNSWGIGWGEMGYGWIPYKYFEDKLADDCWTLISQEWVDHLQFQE